MRTLVGLFVLAVLVVTTLTTSALGDTDQPSSGAQAPKGPAGDVRVPASPPADESLTTAQYVELGIPSPDRTWGGADMTRVQGVLAALATESPRRLPRFDSPRSGDVFARMCSRDNLAMYQDRTLPLESRVGGVIEYQQSSTAVLKTYLAAFGKNAVSPRDFIELLGASMHTCAVMADLADQVIESIGEDDPKREVRLRGIQQMKGGMASMVAGSLQSLTERETYSATDRIALIGHLKAEMPAILPRLTEASRAEVVGRIQTLAADESLEDLRPAITELLEVVSTPAAGTPTAP